MYYSGDTVKRLLHACATMTRAHDTLRESALIVIAGFVGASASNYIGSGFWRQLGGITGLLIVVLISVGIVHYGLDTVDPDKNTPFNTRGRNR